MNDDLARARAWLGTYCQPSACRSSVRELRPLVPGGVSAEAFCEAARALGFLVRRGPRGGQYVHLRPAFPGAWSARARAKIDRMRRPARGTPEGVRLADALRRIRKRRALARRRPEAIYRREVLILDLVLLVAGMGWMPPAQLGHLVARMEALPPPGPCRVR